MSSEEASGKKCMSADQNRVPLLCFWRPINWKIIKSLFCVRLVLFLDENTLFLYLELCWMSGWFCVLTCSLHVLSNWKMNVILYFTTIVPDRAVFSAKTYWYFSYFSPKAVIGFLMRSTFRVGEVPLVSTHNHFFFFFYWEIRKIFIWLPYHLELYICAILLRTVLVSQLLNPCHAE